ncbi:MAG: MerR family transcriptional regulator [Desulfuromonas sp.]|nr:MAG: MerR family transcriptional regulator [Desulfuromonas sp.]
MVNSDPVYPISVAAKLVGVHPRTIRIYEDEGLVLPARQGNKRFYSPDDISWIECLRSLIHDQGISIPGLKRLLGILPCWEIKDCPPKMRRNCSALKDLSRPCWERANTTCARDLDHCQSCEVFITKTWGAEPTPQERTCNLN